MSIEPVKLSEDQKKLRRRASGQGLAIGIALGTAAGVLIDNIAVGIAIGMTIGLSIGNFLAQRKVKNLTDHPT